MNHALKKIWDWDLQILAPLLVLSLYRTFSHSVWLVQSGRGLPGSQDSEWYLNYAQSLLEQFAIRMNIDEILYLGYNLLLTGLLALFKDPVAIVYTQALIASLAIILVYQLGKTLFNKRTGVIAGLFYLYNWDVTLWSTYILSDSLFVSLLLLCVFLLIKATDSSRTTPKIVFSLVALYMCFFRPTGVVVMAVMLVYIVFRLERKRVIGFLTENRSTLTGTLVLVLVVISALNSLRIFDGFIESLQYNAKLVIYNVYANGRVYDIATGFDYFYHPDYSIDIADSLVLSFVVKNRDAVLVLYFRRAVAFLGAWTWMTPIHTVEDLLFYLYKLAPAVFFTVGTVAALRDGKFGRAAVLWWIIAAVFAFCILLFIDAMYRYRFPAMPFVGIIAAYGLDRIICGGHGLARKCLSGSV